MLALLMLLALLLLLLLLESLTTSLDICVSTSDSSLCVDIVFLHTRGHKEKKKKEGEQVEMKSVVSR